MPGLEVIVSARGWRKYKGYKDQVQNCILFIKAIKICNVYVRNRQIGFISIIFIIDKS